MFCLYLTQFGGVNLSFFNTLLWFYPVPTEKYEKYFFPQVVLKKNTGDKKKTIEVAVLKYKITVRSDVNIMET